MRNNLKRLDIRWMIFPLLAVFLILQPFTGHAALKITGKGQPKIEEVPKAPPAKTEPAKAEAPKEEPPKAEAPKAEPAKVEAPKVEPAKVEAPKVEPAKVEAPKVEPAKVEAPKTVKPAIAAPKVEETISKESAKDEDDGGGADASGVVEENVDEPVATGPLKVDSDPQGAKVFIDGEEHGITPVVIDGLTSTPHELVLYHSKLGAFSKKLESGSGEVFVRLTAAAAGGVAGFINITTEPANARIDVDGKNMGLSPAKLPVSAGRHTILISRAGYADKEVTITVPEKGTVDVKETLKEKPGAILVIASPADSEIYLDGALVGKAAGPLRIADVATGIHEVKIEKKGFASWKRDNVTVVREKTETLLVTLYPLQNEASVRIYTEPEGARVWLDGKEVGVSGPDGIGFVTTKGAHILKMEVNPAVNPGYRPLQVTVTFEEDRMDFKGVPFKLPVIDEAFIRAQEFYERGDGEKAISYLDRVGKDQSSYPESRVMMIEILKDLGRITEIPAELNKLFERQVYLKNPILNVSMGYWCLKASAKSQGPDTVRFLQNGLEALDRATEMIDYFPAAQRQALAMKAYYYAGLTSEMLFDLTGDKKYVKKGVQAWELFFGRMGSGEETLGDAWVEKAKRHRQNLQYLEKKLGS